MISSNQKYTVLIISTLAVLTAAIYGYTQTQQELDLDRNLTTLNQTTISYNTSQTTGNITTYVMDNKELRAKGLMNITKMEKDGMIFVYEEADSRSFWMKNTYMPIYIYFLDKEGNTLNRNFAEAPDQPENVRGGGQHTYSSNGNAKYVIELRKEVVERKEITEETVFDVSRFQ